MHLAAVMVPLMAADVLPAPPSMMAFITQAAPPPPPPPPPAPPMTAAAPRTVMKVNPAAAPIEAPWQIKPETGLEPEATAGKGVEGGLPDGIQGSIMHSLPEAPPPPPPAPTAPIRISLGIRQPTKIRDVQPLVPG